MSKLPIEYLKHIYDECLFITDAIPPEMTKDRILKMKRKSVLSSEAWKSLAKRQRKFLLTLSSTLAICG